MVDLTVVNKESLEFLGACKDGAKWFLRNIGELPVNKLDEIVGDYEHYIRWLKNNYPISVDGDIHMFRGGFIKTYDDNGNELTYKNSDGFNWTKTYDDKGNILTYKNSNGFNWTRTYDDNGNALTYTDSNEFYWTNTYDDNGNALTYTDSDGFYWTRTYDDNGNELSYTDSDGDSWTNTFEYLKSDEFFIVTEDGEEILRVPLK